MPVGSRNTGDSGALLVRISNTSQKGKRNESLVSRMHRSEAPTAAMHNGDF